MAGSVGERNPAACYPYATTIFICILAESLIRVAPIFLSELYAVSSTNSVV